MSFKVNPNSKCGALWYCSHWLPFVGGWCVPTPAVWLAVLLPAAECASPPVDGRLTTWPAPIKHERQYGVPLSGRK